MKFLKNIWERSRRNLKFSIENPESFKEVWAFNSTSLRVISLFLAILLIYTFIILYFFGGAVSDLRKGEVSIEREDLEKQRKEIDDLTKKLNYQEKYIAAISKILSGEVPVESDPDSIYAGGIASPDSIADIALDDQQQLARKVREDATDRSVKSSKNALFLAPVKGVISQKYDKSAHPGMDIVTKKDEVVKSCLPGTVIYAGFTRKDGYVVIINHSNDFISVYKHNRTILKKNGDKVKTGDPIAIVGNTGENTDGPHLHFELWYNQSPVDPGNYIRITR